MKKTFIIISLIFFALIIEFFSGCSKEDSSLAPYAGSPQLSKITVEQGVFKPKMTWVGGKISAIAVNRGTKAALDSSLVWMVYLQGDQLDYPIKFGQLPSGAKDVTQEFGGHKADSLSEDQTFTFWVIKDNVWSQISTSKGKYLKVDPLLNQGSVKLIKDTLFISQSSLTVKTQNLDVFVNINDIWQYGSLATVNVTQPTKTPEVLISWEINQEVTNDSLVSAVGVCLGESFDENYQVWAAWSEDIVNSSPVYGKTNRISSPVKIGNQINGTKVFYEFPAEGLTRGKYYTAWIGNKNWDQKGRFRYTPFYAYATFHVW